MALDSEAGSKARIGHFFEERLKLPESFVKQTASAVFYLMRLSAQAVLLKYRQDTNLEGLKREANSFVANAISTAEESDWKP